MRILGIDPGYATTGFGILEAGRGSVQLLNYGTITTPTTLTFPERLVVLYDDMVQLIETVKPDAVAVEELFWGHNVTTGIGVRQKSFRGAEDEIKYGRDCIVVLSGEVWIVHDTGL